MTSMDKPWQASANRDYLGSWDLTTGTSQNGKLIYGEIKATIKSVTLDEKVIDMDKGGNSKKDCTVIRFVENLKPMILNSTNKKAISAVAKSPVPKFWIGKEIIIFVQTGVYMPGTKKADNITTDALRIRPFPPVQEITYNCSNCNAVINENMKVRTEKAFGKILCAECGKKEAEARQAEAKQVEMESVADEPTNNQGQIDS